MNTFVSPLQLVTLAPGERVLGHLEGVMAAVTIVEDGQGERHLKINNRFQMGARPPAIPIAGRLQSPCCCIRPLAMMVRIVQVVPH
jgi:hypothetical protein